MKTAFSKLLSMLGITREAAAQIRSAPKAAPQPITPQHQGAKTDRERLYWQLWMNYGVTGARLEALKADLEPLFRMADSACSSFSLAEGTNPGYQLKDRPRPGGTLTLHLEELTVIDEEEFQDGELIPSYREIIARFQPPIEPYVEQAKMVELGSLLGGTLLDAMYSAIPRTKKMVGGQVEMVEGEGLAAAEYAIQWCYAQVMVLYRVAVAVAGLEHEGAILGNQIKLYMRYAAEQIGRWNDDSYDGITYESADSCEETAAAS